MIFEALTKRIEKRNIKRLKTYDGSKEFEELVFILYLRSFREDGYNRELPLVRSSTFVFPFGLTVPSLELRLVRKFGPFMSIIKALDQKRDIQEPGAARLHMDDKWKQVIARFIYNAQIILFKPSDSESLLWEFKQIVQMGFLYKTVIVLAFGKGESREVDEIYKQRFLTLLREEYQIDVDDILGIEKYMTIDGEGVVEKQPFLEFTKPYLSWLERRRRFPKMKDFELIEMVEEEEGEYKPEEKLYAEKVLIKRGFKIEVQER